MKYFIGVDTLKLKTLSLLEQRLGKQLAAAQSGLSVLNSLGSNFSRYPALAGDFGKLVLDGCKPVHSCMKRFHTVIHDFSPIPLCYDDEVYNKWRGLFKPYAALG